jgi:hypothetical protein
VVIETGMIGTEMRIEREVGIETETARAGCLGEPTRRAARISRFAATASMPVVKPRTAAGIGPTSMVSPGAGKVSATWMAAWSVAGEVGNTASVGDAVKSDREGLRAGLAAPP